MCIVASLKNSIALTIVCIFFLAGAANRPAITTNEDQLRQELTSTKIVSHAVTKCLSSTLDSMKKNQVVDLSASLHNALSKTVALSCGDTAVYREVLKRNRVLKDYLFTMLAPILSLVEAAFKCLIINVADAELFKLTGRARWHCDHVLASDNDFPIGDGPYSRLANKLLGATDGDKIYLDPKARLSKSLRKLKVVNDDSLRLLGH